MDYRAEFERITAEQTEIAYELATVTVDLGHIGTVEVEAAKRGRVLSRSWRMQNYICSCWQFFHLSSLQGV